MSLLVKQSIGQMKCEIVGHEITQEDEDKLYVVPDRELETSCARCGASLFLKMNPVKEDEYFETEL
jgi:hypothetical protein